MLRWMILFLQNKNIFSWLSHSVPVNLTPYGISEGPFVKYTDALSLQKEVPGF